MGAQSFDPAVLAALERVHGPDSVRRAVTAARRAGYANLSIDLIYGADGRLGRGSGRCARRSPRARAPQRVRAHDRAVHAARPAGSRSAPGRPPTRTCRRTCSGWRATCSAGPGTGTTRYRTGPDQGFECRHNLGYWERRPYLGLGAGAHSYRDDRRWWNVRPPEEYLRQVESGRLPVGGEERLEPSDAYLEEVFLRLRILEGIPASWVEPRTAEPFLESGLLRETDGALVPTERGMLLLNELVLALAG